MQRDEANGSDTASMLTKNIEALRLIIEGTATSTGSGFFKSLVEHLAKVIGTPCQEVISGGFCFYPSGLQLKYPETEPGIESYLGVPLTTRDGQILGHLCALDESPLPNEPERLAIFRIFAARAAAELDRIRMEKGIREQELRMRDLFEEAPIAYVHETLD